jgi:acetyltransferase
MVGLDSVGLSRTVSHLGVQESPWAGRKLAGYRQIQAGDATAVTQILVRLGQLAADFPQLAEIEINPVRVLEKGAWAVDVRGRLA